MKRIIKYAALIFALVLSASIIGGCLLAGVSIIQSIREEMAYPEELEGQNNNLWYRTEDGDVVFLGMLFNGSGDVKSGSELFMGSDIDSLYLEGITGELIVEVWDNDSVSVDYENISEDYKIGVDNGTLVIEREDGFFFWNTVFTETPKIRVSVPADLVFEEVEVDKGSGSAKIIGISVDKLSIDNGSGGVGISDVTAEELHVDSGSGGVNISNVTAEKTVFYSGSGSFTVQNSNIGETSMDTGSGFVNFENISARNLVVDSGSGRVDISGVLTGNCVFDSGSGSLNVVIYGQEEEYNIRTDMGSGSFYLNGDKEKDSHIEHNGADHLLVFDAGSGRVSVEFKEAAGNGPEDVQDNAQNNTSSQTGENYDR